MYQHNKIVYEELKHRLKTDSRVCIVQATGTGKGVIARTLIEEYEFVIVVAPTKAILENYKMNLKVNGDNVHYYTYKSISVQLNAQLDSLAQKTNLLILDEFHRIGAKTWGRKVEYLASKVEKSNGKVVGLSATPIRYLDNERDMSVEFFKCNVINGLDIVPVEANFYFDFGNGTVQDGYTGVTASTSYSSELGYGFTTSAQSEMNRAPGSIASGYDNLYNDQINSTTYADMQFDVDVPNGTYLVKVHYGSWNTGFGTEFVVEGSSSGDLYSTTAATYETYATVTDGKLSVVIAQGAKKYGGYINGLDIEFVK